MIISAKIYSIKQINSDITNIILVKSRNKKEYFMSILCYFHFSDVVKDYYLKGDYIKVWFRLRSIPRLSVNNDVKYYTDIIAEQIVLVKRKGLVIKKIVNEYGMKEKHKYYFEDTGEIVTKHSVKSSIKDNPNRNKI